MRTPAAHPAETIENAAIPTWFGVGGGAARLAFPRDEAELARCLADDPDARLLGEGANLLVDDDGVPGLVVSLARGEFARAQFAGDGVVHAGAGADLPKLVTESCRRGLAGLEGLGGIPASLGGALVMNAGGAFGQIADAVRCVRVIDRQGRVRTLGRDAIAFAYRRSGLGEEGPGLVVLGAELALTPGDPAAVRARLKDVMAYKKQSQPMGERSAGCCFRNPTLERPIEGLAPAGTRVSAGLLIDRAGCKGLGLGSARVSERHANFLTAQPGGRARDVIDLMRAVRRRVFEAFGVTLEREVVVWSQHPESP